jgi:hypothetical protein
VPQAVATNFGFTVLKNSRFVSGHRFSDAVSSSESEAPSGAGPSKTGFSANCSAAEARTLQHHEIRAPRRLARVERTLLSAAFDSCPGRDGVGRNQVPVDRAAERAGRYFSNSKEAPDRVTGPPKQSLAGHPREFKRLRWSGPPASGQAFSKSVRSGAPAGMKLWKSEGWGTDRNKGGFRLSPAYPAG